MNELLSSLDELCQRYPLQEKVLIVPGYGAGHELCEALARASGGWVNLRPETTAGLAHRIACEYLAEKQLTWLSGQLSAVVVEEVFQELEGKKALHYFAREGGSPGLVRAIASSILELRSAGVTCDSLSVESFVSPEKGQDLLVLLKAYERYLEQHHYLDTPGLLALALRLLPSTKPASGDRIFLLPSFLQLYPLESQLIESAAGGSLYTLDTDPVGAPDGPGPPAPCSFCFFHAYGLRNEVKEIFRQLQGDGLALDSVTVACTSSEYLPAFYALARRFGVGLTVSEGIPAFLTGPGRVLQGLIDWIRSDYSAAVLRDLILCGDLQLGGVQEAAAARLLRDAGIGWGRERYQLLEGRGEQAEQLYKIVAAVLASLPTPDADSRISFKELACSLSEILPRLARTRDELDAAALTGLVEAFVQTGKLASFSLEVEQALERVETLIKGFRAGASGPRPGHLHLVSFSSLIWSNRPYTFVVGLDADSFPGSGCQDPVLLDAERRLIHPGLPLGVARPEENRHTLALALASRRGRVTLSFPSFDIVENRQLCPSSVLLQLYRLLKGDLSLDYSDLMDSLGKPAGFYCPEGRQALDEVEWWAGKVLSKPGIRNGPAAVRVCYRGIELGQLAWEARNSPEPTEYDGVIEVSPGELDPRCQDSAVSSTRIEYLAGCPFAYFLRYLLGVDPPQELVYDPGRWLGSLDRGLLLHDLFCSFLKKTADRGERPELAAHRSLMVELADQLIEEYRERIPPPSELVYNHEVQELHRCCEVFLAAEEAAAGGVPVLLEVPFGFGAEAVNESGCGLAEPVEIELGAGTSFLLNGKIDRIDQVGDGVYHLWDYKTGSLYGYDDHRQLCGGRQVQHALYAIAAERILKGLHPGERPRVELSGYYFPTVRGEGRQVARMQSGRAELFQVLNHLFDILSSGSFVAADDKAICGICDYPEVCGGDSAAARAEQLLKNGAPCLEPWRRLKDIE